MNKYENFESDNSLILDKHLKKYFLLSFWKKRILGNKFVQCYLSNHTIWYSVTHKWFNMDAHMYTYVLRI